MTVKLRNSSLDKVKKVAIQGKKTGKSSNAYGLLQGNESKKVTHSKSYRSIEQYYQNVKSKIDPVVENRMKSATIGQKLPEVSPKSPATVSSKFLLKVNNTEKNRMKKWQKSIESKYITKFSRD